MSQKLIRIFDQVFPAYHAENPRFSRIDRIVTARRFKVAGHTGQRGRGTRLDLAGAIKDVPPMQAREDPMNDLDDGRGVSLDIMAVVPQALVEPLVLVEPEELSASIERAVHEQTAGGIANLAVVVEDGSVFLHGSCASYYHKQLAQHAAMTVPALLAGANGLAAATGLTLTNCIEVD